MPTIGNLRTSLRRLCVIPTSRTLRIIPPQTPYARIQHVPLVVSRASSTATSSSKLVVSGKLEAFPLGISNFREIRELPGMAYFDKTKYIPVIAKGTRAQLICRPRRFGKSLTITTLRYFHGFEYRDQYDKLFKDLDVDRAVKDGQVKPGQFLVLEFDFSRVARPPRIVDAGESLNEEINDVLSEFKSTYGKYLGETFTSDTSQLMPNNPSRNLKVLVAAVDRALQDIHDRNDKDHPLFDVQGIYLLADEYDAYANEYMDPHDPRSWSEAQPFRVLKAFWTNVKASKKAYYGIKRVYITGVTPLLISDLTSGANDQENISISPLISDICGLTRSDVLGALKAICNDEEEVQKHLRELERFANGYHFCQERRVEPVFNTYTALSYLQSVKLGVRPDAENPQNSEVSDQFLRICAGAPAAVQEIQVALQKDEQGSYKKLPCNNLLTGFKLSELSTQAAGEGDISAWQSLMFYMGGLTFDSDDPSSFLKIPNLVAAKRFGHALLDRIGLYSSMKDALYTLAKTGNPKDLLAGYCRLMQERDVADHAFKKNEEHHRDSVRYAILENPAIKPKAEYEVRKWTDQTGFVDLLIKNDEGLYTVLEFKNIQIRYLELTGVNTGDKAKRLEAMKLNQILKLKFSKYDQYRSGTIRNWFDGKSRADMNSGIVRKQLQSYIMGPTVQQEIAGKKLRAFVVVILGLRHILMREMDWNGNWVDEFQLAQGLQ